MDGGLSICDVASEADKSRVILVLNGHTQGVTGELEIKKYCIPLFRLSLCYVVLLLESPV